MLHLWYFLVPHVERESYCCAAEDADKVVMSGLNDLLGHVATVVVEGH